MPLIADTYTCLFLFSNKICRPLHKLVIKYSNIQEDEDEENGDERWDPGSDMDIDENRCLNFPSLLINLVSFVLLVVLFFPYICFPFVSSFSCTVVQLEYTYLQKVGIYGKNCNFC